MYILNVKNSQNEFVNTGFLFQNTYYVDQKIENGIPIATFCSVSSGTSDCPVIGSIQATLKKAGKDSSKASGVIYTTSAKDMYGRTDDFSDELMLYPYGRRQDKAIGLLKKCVIEISDGTKKHFFRTFDEVLAKNVAVSSNNKLTVTYNPNLKYGDKIELTDLGNENKKSIHHITEVNDNEITFTPDATVVGNVDVDLKCQIDDPIYLNKQVTTNGTYSKAEELPFTTIRTKQSGEIDQLIGYIESPVAVRINLTLDINPEKVK